MVLSGQILRFLFLLITLLLLNESCKNASGDYTIKDGESLWEAIGINRPQQNVVIIIPVEGCECVQDALAFFEDEGCMEDVAFLLSSSTHKLIRHTIIQYNLDTTCVIRDGDRSSVILGYVEITPSILVKDKLGYRHY